jgi:FAD/FMN-containing dehydrogenase
MESLLGTRSSGRARPSPAGTSLRMTGLEGHSVDVPARAVEDFSARIAGPTLQPGDAGFEEAVTIWNGMISKRPSLVVQPISMNDVREAIGFARSHGLLLSIKGGGHNIAGTSLADGGLTLDMGRMRRVEVDPERRIARVGPGCILGDVDPATQQYGLATVLGQVTQTGVAGLTLGGGFGYLTRRFGSTVDNLQEVEIVTADGNIRRAAEDEHEDLFWALRGGGGNFGVVTRFTYRLHRVGPEVTGGRIFWDAESSDEVVRLFQDLAEVTPKELTLSLAMHLAPPAPFIPETLHGRPVVSITACHTGELSKAAKDLAPIRNVGRPIADLMTQRSYVEQQSLLDPIYPKGLHYYWKSEFFPGLSEDLLRTCVEHSDRLTSPMSHIILLQLGGALAELDTSTPFGNRDAAFVFFGVGAWPPDSPEPERHRGWVRSAWESVRPYSTGGNYVNAQTADEDESRMKEAYRDNLDRLRSVKATYDPDNLFRVNRNISPIR